MTPRNPRPLALLAALFASGACVKPLTTLPPSDVYVDAETPPRELSGEEKQFIDGMNVELQKLGMPPATVGGYEMNAAAVLADLGLAKMYRGSSREFAEDKSDDVATVSKGGEVQQSANVTVAVQNDPNGFLSEAGDIDFSRLHRDQHLSSRGLPFDFYSDVQVINFEQHSLTQKELMLTARRAHFYPVYGRLRIGAAVLVDGEDNKRFYALVIRDERINVTKGAPRMIAAGGTFELAGQIVDRGLTPLAVGVQGPSSVTVDPVEVADDGSFHATLKLPSASGLYVVSLGRTHGDDPVPYTVAVFAGVEPTPWPSYPTGKPPTDAYAIADQLARAVNAFRQSHGLSVLTIPPGLAAFQKTEAESYAEALRAARQGKATALAEWKANQAGRAKAAGFDASRFDGRQLALTNHQAENLPARFPPDAIAAYKLAQPDVTELGLGVAAIPATADPTQPPYVVSWATARPGK